MDDRQFFFEGFNPLLSFDKGSIGFNTKKLIGLDGNAIDAPERLWFVGFKAYSYFFDNYDSNSDLSIIEINMTEVIKFIEGIYEHQLQCIKDGTLIPIDSIGNKIEDFEPYKRYCVEDKALSIEASISELDITVFETSIPHFYYAYLCIYVIESLCVLNVWHISDCHVGINTEIHTAEMLLNIVDKYEAINRSAKEKSKKAANAKHLKHSLPKKVAIENWYKSQGNKNDSINKLAENAAFKLDVPFSTARNVISSLRKSKIKPSD